MSYPKELDEYSDESLEQELAIRKARREIGHCDYCNKPGNYRACRFVERHRRARTIWENLNPPPGAPFDDK